MMDKKKPSDWELEKRRLNLQEDLHELIRDGAGKSNIFWDKQEEMNKIRVRIYKRAIKKTRGIVIQRKK